MTVDDRIYKETEGVASDTLPLFSEILAHWVLLCFERFNEVVEHLRGIRRECLQNTMK
jgi:hypothetical protein